MFSLDLRTRLIAVYVVLMFAGLVIAARLFYWQILRYDEMSALAEQERARSLTLEARRGDILTADGFLLASDVYVYEVVAFPKQVAKPLELAGILSPLLNRSQAELAQQLGSSQPMVMLDRFVRAEVGPQLEELRKAKPALLRGVSWSARPYRRYPGDSFAAAAVGFVTGERKGAYGVEQYYDDRLRGRNGQMYLTVTGDGRDALPFDLPQGQDAVDGARLHLTLISGVQLIAERELQRAVVSNGATGGSVVVLDVKSGAIRGLATYPAGNLNEYAKAKDYASYNNGVVSLTYEPGSVFKAVTLACALDYGTVNQNTLFNDTGSFTVGGRTIYNANMIRPGTVDLVKVMKLSLNVEAARMAVMMGASKFYDCVRRFGFGALSNVDLAGEVPGTLKLPGDGRWYEADLGANSFGQGLAATPLQMAAALAAIANGGRWTPPYIVERVVSPGGHVVAYQPRGTRQVIRPETAANVTSILSKSIDDESQNRASVPGYRIAGKTGTSQIPIPGGYDANATIASFGGYFPADDPLYLVLVKIDRPKKSPWGSEVASPVFGAIAQQIAALTGLPPDAERLSVRASQ